METTLKDETQAYREFKGEYGNAIKQVAQCYRNFVLEGDSKGLATFNLLILTMMAAATDEINKAWPSNVIPGGIGERPS